MEIKVLLMKLLSPDYRAVTQSFTLFIVLVGAFLAYLYDPVYQHFKTNPALYISALFAALAWIFNIESNIDKAITAKSEIERNNKIQVLSRIIEKCNAQQHISHEPVLNSTELASNTLDEISWLLFKYISLPNDKITQAHLSTIAIEEDLCRQYISDFLDRILYKLREKRQEIMSKDLISCESYCCALSFICKAELLNQAYSSPAQFRRKCMDETLHDHTDISLKHWIKRHTSR